MARNYQKMNQAQTKYKFAIVPGNNGTLIRKCLELRSSRWEETTLFDKLFNLKWQ
jgi:hypothetical protein